MKNKKQTVHRFENAGLGRAPFRFMGMTKRVYQACSGAPIQPGASCDYCGTGIMYVYHIQDADGKKFHVGCECVRHTGDQGLIDLIARKVREQKREARHESERARIVQAKQILDDVDVRIALQIELHPLAARNEYFGSQSRLDWAEWMMENSGNKGCLVVARYLGKFKEGLES